jgi:N-methylhydantoinase A
MTAPHVTNTLDFDYDGVRATLDGLRERMAAFESELPAGLAGTVQRRYFVEARYAYQVWDLSIPLDGDGIENEAALTRLIESFHDAHERIFAVREPGQKIELSQWKGRVIAETVKPPLAGERASREGAGEDGGGQRPAASRRVAFFPELGEVEIDVHLGEQLAPGTRLSGPALVIEPETTIVVYPGWIAHVSELGNYRLELDDA